MTGSASTALCSGLTVTQPEATETAARANAASAPRFLEVHTEASFVELGIAIRVFREEGQVADLEADEDAQAQRQQEAASRTRGPHRFLAQDELVDVGVRRHAAEAERAVGLDRPVGGQVHGERASVEKLVAVLDER